MKNLTIVGGGPAALMLAAAIDTSKFNVTLYDKKKTVGRKFLVAGEGGLNLTYNSSLERFIDQYSPKAFIKPILRTFSNKDLIDWFAKLGIPTFVGSSHRVFPEKGIKPIEVLNTIIGQVKSNGVQFKLDKEWKGWTPQGHLIFDDGEIVKSDITVFALGGASWRITGSDGHWRDLFLQKGIEVKPFRAANCAFEVAWKKDFIQAHEGKPLKNIALSFANLYSKGELVISKFGLEGNAIYALSEKIQNQFLKHNKVIIYVDLKPMHAIEQIQQKLKNSRQQKITQTLHKDLKLDRTAIALLKQMTSKETFSNLSALAKSIKALPIPLASAAPIDEAISTLGGIALDEIDENLQLKKLPNAYVMGEMIDWYAPTGGYLLQGSFSMGYTLAMHLNKL